MSENILYERHGRTVLITINRPEKRNALSFAALADLNAAVDEATADDDALAVVLTGAGGAFCAGSDLADLQGTPVENRGSRSGRDTAQGFMLHRCLKPFISAIDGPAVGLGAELTTQSDVRVASTRARFAWNFVHRGLVPDTGAASWLLPKQIGFTEAFRLVISGEFMSAERALEIGYVTAVVEPDKLIDAALEEAGRLSTGSPLAIRYAKELMYAGLDRSVPEHLERNREIMAALFKSEDHREGVASFLERREPKFVGR